MFDINITITSCDRLLCGWYTRGLIVHQQMYMYRFNDNVDIKFEGKRKRCAHESFDKHFCCAFSFSVITTPVLYAHYTFIKMTLVYGYEYSC